MNEDKKTKQQLLAEIAELRRRISFLESGRAEKLLQKSTADLEEVQQIARLGRWEFDPRDSCLWWSDGIYRLFEVSRDDFALSYDAFTAFVHPDDRAMVAAAYRRSVENHEPYEITHRLRMRDGRVKWVHEMGRTEYDVDGRPIRSIGTVQDVTDLTLAQENLKIREERLRLALEIARLGTWHWDLATNETSWSDDFISMLGFKLLDGFVPSFATFLSAIHPDDRERVAASNRRAIETRGGYHEEYRVCWPDGSERFIAATGRVFSGHDGTALRMEGVAVDVTDRKAAEAALQNVNAYLEREVTARTSELAAAELQARHALTKLAKSESLFRTIFQQAPMGVALVDSLNGRLLQVNESFEKITHRSREELIGADWKQLTHPEDVQREADNLARLTAGEIASFQMDKRYVRPDESLIWMSVTVASVTVAPGERPLHLKMVENITDRIAAEEQVKARERDLRTILDNIPTPIGYADLGPTGKVRFFNKQFHETFGYSLDEVATIGDWYQRAFPDLDYRHGIMEAWNAAMANGAGREVRIDPAEYRVTCKDGTVRDILGSGVILGSWVVVSFVDITEHKRAEEERQFNERKYKTILQTAIDGFWRVSPEGRILEVNDAYCRMSGYNSQEILSKSLRDFDVSMTPADIAENMQRIIDRGEHRFETVHRRKDGTEMTVEVSAQFRPADGYFASFLRDITNRKRDETELREHRDRLDAMVKQRTRELETALHAAEAANRAKSSFLANMSHEIRTPLNAILGFAQLMVRDATTTPQHRDQLQTINRNGQHLLTLINSVLEMAKLEAGQASIHLGAFDLRAVLRDLESMFRLRADSKNLLFELSHAADLPRYVVTDEGKLRQILVNLLGNAVKFTSKGGIALRVQTTAGPYGMARLFVEVADTGSGIAEEEMDRLFLPFSQTNVGVSTSGGTGLGLAISRELARLMGGDITAASTPGSGSLFRLEIPVEVSNEVHRFDDSQQEREYRLKPGQAAFRILVVDDLEDNRNFLEQMLQRAGFEVRVCANGLDALQSHESWRPHAILLDMRMPGMGGDEVLRRVRSPGNPPVKVVCVTAAAFEEDRQQALSLGADDFIAKPFRDVELFEKLSTLLELEYLGEEETKATYEASDSLTPESIATLPADLVRQMREAARFGDLDRFLNLLSAVEQHSVDMAQGLRELADAFDLQRLLELLAVTQSDWG